MENGLARHLPGHFPGCRGIRMGSHVSSVQGPAPSGEKQEIWRKQEGRSDQQAATCKKSGDLEKTKALWSWKEAKDEGTDFWDLGSVQPIQTRSQVRWDLWGMHLKSPTAALADAVSDTEDGAGRAAVPPPQVEAKRERRFLFRMFCVILSCIATFRD